jgi:hypothetical protein
MGLHLRSTATQMTPSVSTVSTTLHSSPDSVRASLDSAAQAQQSPSNEQLATVVECVAEVKAPKVGGRQATSSAA